MTRKEGSTKKRGVRRFTKTLVAMGRTLSSGVMVMTRSDGFSSTTLNVPRYRDDVVPGPIVKGNLRNYNPWSYVVYHRRYVNGNFLINDQSVANAWTNYSGDLKNFDANDGFKWTFPQFDPDYLYNQALDRLNEKVRGGLDLSVAAFEGRQTLRMIAALGKAKRYITGFGTKRMANEWLEFTYGWKPLASDIFGIADESVRYNLNRIKNVRAGANDRLPSGKMTVRFGTTDVPVQAKAEGILSTRISMEFETKDFDIARWSSLNPVSIAWELMPYSFVVDWFYDIGGYLRNLETALLYGCRFVRGYRSHLYVADVTLESGRYVLKTSGIGYNVYNLSGWESYKGFTRSVLTSYPFPRPPSFETSLGSNRLLSAAALLRQLIRR